MTELILRKLKDTNKVAGAREQPTALFDLSLIRKGGTRERARRAFTARRWSLSCRNAD